VSGCVARGFVGYILVTTFRTWATSQVLRVHLTEPRSYPLPLTDYGTVLDLKPGIIALEPSRSATTVAEMAGVGIQVRDWTCGRSVMISTPRANNDHEYVSTFHDQSSPDERCS